MRYQDLKFDEIYEYRKSKKENWKPKDTKEFNLRLRKEWLALSRDIADHELSRGIDDEFGSYKETQLASILSEYGVSSIDELPGYVLAENPILSSSDDSIDVDAYTERVKREFFQRIYKCETVDGKCPFDNDTTWMLGNEYSEFKLSMESRVLEAQPVIDYSRSFTEPKVEKEISAEKKISASKQQSVTPAEKKPQPAGTDYTLFDYMDEPTDDESFIDFDV